MSADDYAMIRIGKPSGKFYVQFGTMSDEDGVGPVTLETPAFEEAKDALQFAEQRNCEYGIRFGEDVDDPPAKKAAEILNDLWELQTAEKAYRPRLRIGQLIAVRHNAHFYPQNAMIIEWMGRAGNKVVVAGSKAISPSEPVTMSCYDWGRDFLPIPSHLAQPFLKGE